MPIVPGGGDRWAGRRALELVIAEALAEEITDDEARRILGKSFDFVVTPAARRVSMTKKSGQRCWRKLIIVWLSGAADEQAGFRQECCT